MTIMNSFEYLFGASRGKLTSRYRSKTGTIFSNGIMGVPKNAEAFRNALPRVEKPVSLAASTHGGVVKPGRKCMQDTTHIGCRHIA